MRQNIDFNEAPYCAVGNSRICDGQGLFALKDFNASDVVIDYSLSSVNWTLCKFADIPKDFADCC